MSLAALYLGTRKSPAGFEPAALGLGGPTRSACEDVSGR